MSATLRTLSIALLLAPLASAWAYLPLRYSPLDVYVSQSKRQGPSQVLVHRDGKLRATARLEYDATGRLVKEHYTAGGGKTGGVTSYEYEDGRIVRETTRDTKGAVTTVKEFRYSAGALASMQVKDAGGNVLLEQRYSSRSGRIVSGKQVIGGEEHFQVEYHNGGPSLLKVLREDGKEIGRISFRYSSDGRVLERLREQGSLKQRCRYVYGQKGRLESYVYEEANKGSWRPVKTIKLVY